MSFTREAIFQNVAVYVSLCLFSLTVLAGQGFPVLFSLNSHMKGIYSDWLNIFGTLFTLYSWNLAAKIFMGQSLAMLTNPLRLRKKTQIFGL